MRRDEIIHWRDRYDSEEVQYDNEYEGVLRTKFQKYRCISKEDLIRIVKWNFQGRLEGRRDRIIKLIKYTDGDCSCPLKWPSF